MGDNIGKGMSVQNWIQAARQVNGNAITKKSKKTELKERKNTESGHGNKKQINK